MLFRSIKGALKPMHVFDLTTTQSCATNDPLELPEYHYGSFGLRGPDEWNGKDGARFLTSEGITDRKKGDSTRARWCYLGGKTDAVMMRIVDIMYAVPYLLIAILLVTVLGRDFYLVVLAITAFSWMDTARLVRGQTLSLRKMEFVEAARAMGVSTPRIVIEHIVPNLLGLVLVYATVTVPSVILTESVLSFLGLGIQEPMTSWGVLIHDGAQMLESAPWLLIFPALLLSLTLYSFNYLGDGLRDALDPKDR